MAGKQDIMDRASMEQHTEISSDGEHTLPCGCKAPRVGVEYGHPHPEQYDGISEWICTECHRRFGRWSGKELFGDEYENRYGRKR
jgi:hypothetical protein